MSLYTFAHLTNSKDLNYGIAKGLFVEYAKVMGLDLTFQGFTSEIQNLHQMYSHPHGAIVLAFYKNHHEAGCIAVRKLEENIAELKRMYIRNSFRSQGIGRKLLEKALSTAKNLGYKKIRLDTLPSMVPAIKLYEEYGFIEIEPYYHNPISGAKFYEKKLNK